MLTASGLKMKTFDSFWSSAKELLNSEIAVPYYGKGCEVCVFVCLVGGGEGGSTKGNHAQ